MAFRQIKSGKATGPDNMPAEALNEVRHRSNYKHALPSIQKDLGGGTSANGVERRTPRQDSKERRSEVM
ncbi:unnamed protein product [Schistosoma mattheei]|uniref:Uncharacterized protein n=1 Tax=Schistosoma mattheei TaxID=31246 RepID=A0A183PWF3_9TREM|nr:unnamed protein product [Schistosoma mattheei]